MAPQIIFIALLLFGLGVSAAKHGDEHQDFHFGHAAFRAAVTLFLLWWGGYFDCFFK